MKVILIDVQDRQVKIEEIAWSGDLDGMYRLLKCECFAAPITLDNGDTLYVDDEGMLKPQDDFFTFGNSQPFAGNGLLVGSTEEGESCASKTTSADVAKLVKFMTRREIKAAIARGEFKDC